MLWEIGPDGCDLRELRSRLGLDSGYLTRLVQSLEAADLVTVAPSEADRRTRVASLTPAGLAERRILDERSDAVAQALLDPLSGPHQEELVAAMRCVQRLLSVGAVQVGPVDPEHPDARRCVAAYYDELEQRAGLERKAALTVVPDLVLVAYLHGRAIGTGSSTPRARSSGCGSTPTPAGWAWAAAYSVNWSRLPGRRAPRPFAWTPTAS